MGNNIVGGFQKQETADDRFVAAGRYNSKTDPPRNSRNSDVRGISWS